MKSIYLLLFLLPALCFAQSNTAGDSKEKGIQFEHDLSWNQVREKAKAEGKYVFVDAFTTWCGPCKYMAANIFPLEEVGDFFNDKFINLKVQLDTTDEDSDEVKKWYADAHNIMQEYKVNSFPTYLFFDPNGELVHRALGSSDAKTFLAKAEQALNPETQYYNLVKRYNNGERDTDLLRNLAKAAASANEPEFGGKVLNEYLDTQKDLMTPENIQLIFSLTQTTNDRGFNLMLNNMEKFDEVIGFPNFTRQRVMDMVLYEELFPSMMMVTKPDFVKLQSYLEKKYPTIAKELTAKTKYTFYRQKKDWKNFEAAALDFMADHSKNMNAGELNDMAWSIFERSNSKQALTAALEWSKRSLAENNNAMFIDTYANLLYKLGKKNEAIEWQTKAVSLINEKERKEYQETLDKMKKGEKTWVD